LSFFTRASWIPIPPPSISPARSLCVYNRPSVPSFVLGFAFRSRESSRSNSSRRWTNARWAISYRNRRATGCVKY
jgi:hypothetical protein